MTTLTRKSLLGTARMLIVVWLMIFIPAGSLSYWQGSIFYLVFVTSMSLITAYLLMYDPALLERRMNAGSRAEKEPKQKIIVMLLFACTILNILIPTLAYRYFGSQIPASIVLTGDLLVLLGFFIIFIVFKTNTYTASTVQIASDQTVIDTGPYALVRHPMYSGMLVMLLGTPLALGSLWGLLVFVPSLFAIIWRLLEEEKFLRQKLNGYQDYCKKVRYRLIPFAY